MQVKLKKIFNMSNCKTGPTPVITGLKLSKDYEGSTVDPTLFKRLIGSLMYLIATRLDIMYGVSLISRFMESPKDSHWQVGKRIPMYVSGTKNLVLCIQPQKILNSLVTLKGTMEAA